MVTVVARETFPYAGITRYVGDAFAATADDASILSMIGRIDVIDPQDAPPVSAVHTRARRRREQTSDAE